VILRKEKKRRLASERLRPPGKKIGGGTDTAKRETEILLYKEAKANEKVATPEGKTSFKTKRID